MYGVFLIHHTLLFNPDSNLRFGSVEPRPQQVAPGLSLASLTTVEMTNKMSSRATPRDLNRMDNRKRFLRYGLREGEMTIAGAFFVARLVITKCNYTTQ